MNKCLVTKLNGVVNNNSLTRLGEIKLHCHGTAKLTNKVSGLVTYGVSEIRLLGDGYFTNKEGTTNLGNTKKIDTSTEGVPFPDEFTDKGTVSYFIGSEQDVILKGKYDIKRFTGGNGMNRIGNTAFVYPMNVDLFKYSKNLENFECDYMYMQYVINRNEPLGIEGDLSVFANKPNLLRLSVGGYMQKTEDVNMNINLTGELKELATSPKLILINVNNSDVHGKVEDLLNAMFQNGRRDGEIQIFANSTGVTYNGEAFSQKVFTFTSSSWNEKNT